MKEQFRFIPHKGFLPSLRTVSIYYKGYRVGWYSYTPFHGKKNPLQFSITFLTRQGSYLICNTRQELQNYLQQELNNLHKSRWWNKCDPSDMYNKDLTKRLE